MCPLFRMPPLDCCYPVCFACIIRGFSLRLYISTKSSPGFSTRIVNTRPFQSNPVVSNKAQNSFRTQFEPDRFQTTKAKSHTRWQRACSDRQCASPPPPQLSQPEASRHPLEDSQKSQHLFQYGSQLVHLEEGQFSYSVLRSACDA